MYSCFVVCVAECLHVLCCGVFRCLCLLVVGHPPGFGLFLRRAFFLTGWFCTAVLGMDEDMSVRRSIAFERLPAGWKHVCIAMMTLGAGTAGLQGLSLFDGMGNMSDAMLTENRNVLNSTSCGIPTMMSSRSKASALLLRRHVG